MKNTFFGLAHGNESEQTTAVVAAEPISGQDLIASMEAIEEMIAIQATLKDLDEAYTFGMEAIATFDAEIGLDAAAIATGDKKQMRERVVASFECFNDIAGKLGTDKKLVIASRESEEEDEEAAEDELEASTEAKSEMIQKIIDAVKALIAKIVAAAKKLSAKIMVAVSGSAKALGDLKGKNDKGAASKKDAFTAEEATELAKLLGVYIVDGKVDVSTIDDIISVLAGKYKVVAEYAKFGTVVTEGLKKFVVPNAEKPDEIDVKGLTDYLQKEVGGVVKAINTGALEGIAKKVTDTKGAVVGVKDGEWLKDAAVVSLKLGTPSYKGLAVAKADIGDAKGASGVVAAIKSVKLEVITGEVGEDTFKTAGVKDTFSGSDIDKLIGKLEVVAKNMKAVSDTTFKTADQLTKEADAIGQLALGDAMGAVVTAGTANFSTVANVVAVDAIVDYYNTVRALTKLLAKNIEANTAKAPAGNEGEEEEKKGEEENGDNAGDDKGKGEEE